MQTEKLGTIDDYELALNEAIRTWSPAQRTALAAAMAERWLPVYEEFSAAEQWGDPAALRRSLEAVWDHVRGRALARADLTRYSAQLDECTPHMDDFDALEALAACSILEEALKSCRSADNAAATVMAALAGFEAAVPDWAFEPEEQPRLWKKVAARKELKKQLKVIERVEGLAVLDEAAIKSLRKGLTGPDLVGEASPAAKAEACAPGVTNQQLFEQYRRMVEADLRSQGPLDLPGVSFALLRFTAWAGRYSRRKQTIDGSYGRLADVAAQKALVVRQRAIDAAEKAPPGWDQESAEMIEMCLANPMSLYDVKTPIEPHGYGPSVRRLWAEAKRAGGTDAQAWDAIVAWSRHRPAAWEAEDRRKKKGKASASSDLGEHLGRKLTWSAASDPLHPWATEVDGQQWRVRLNDFPDDLMYTLLVGESEAGSFHDWPETWQRDGV